jgi:hypothetical protein
MHSGGLAADEVPIIAQEGEIMIQRDVAQREGMADFLRFLWRVSWRRQNRA